MEKDTKVIFLENYFIKKGKQILKNLRKINLVKEVLDSMDVVNLASVINKI